MAASIAACMLHLPGTLPGMKCTGCSGWRQAGTSGSGCRTGCCWTSNAAGMCSTPSSAAKVCSCDQAAGCGIKADPVDTQPAAQLAWMDQAASGCSSLSWTVLTGSRGAASSAVKLSSCAAVSVLLMCQPTASNSEPSATSCVRTRLQLSAHSAGRVAGRTSVSCSDAKRGLSSC